MLNMAKVSKNYLDDWWSISIPNTRLPVLYKIQNVMCFFSIMALHDCSSFGFLFIYFFYFYFFIMALELLVWALLPLEQVHTSTRVRARARPSSCFIWHCCTALAREECLQINVFLVVRERLFSFPKDPAYGNSGCSLFFRGKQWSFASLFVCSHHFGDKCCINKAQFGAGFAHRLILKDPSNKRSRSWFGTQVLHDSLTPPTTRLREQEAMVLNKKTC